MQGIDLANPVLFQCAWPSSSSHSPGAESDVPAAPFGPVPPPPRATQCQSSAWQPRSVATSAPHLCIPATLP